jgi:hypothetical protein
LDNFPEYYALSPFQAAAVILDCSVLKYEKIASDDSFGLLTLCGISRR